MKQLNIMEFRKIYYLHTLCIYVYVYISLLRNLEHEKFM